jgi:DNA polymerase-3 subunit alpha
MLSAIKFSHTKNPRPGNTATKYAMWDLEDLDGITRCILWPEQFAQSGHFVESDAILGVVGKVDRRPGGEEVNLIVDKLMPLAEMAKQFSSGMVIRVREEEHGQRALEQLREIVRGYPGTKRLRLRLDLASGGQVWIDSTWSGVEPNPELNERVDQLLGAGNRLLESAPNRPATRSGSSRERAGTAR